MSTTNPGSETDDGEEMSGDIWPIAGLNFTGIKTSMISTRF